MSDLSLRRNLHLKTRFLPPHVNASHLLGLLVPHHHRKEKMQQEPSLHRGHLLQEKRPQSTFTDKSTTARTHNPLFGVSLSSPRVSCSHAPAPRLHPSHLLSILCHRGPSTVQQQRVTAEFGARSLRVPPRARRGEERARLRVESQFDYFFFFSSFLPTSLPSWAASTS